MFRDLIHGGGAAGGWKGEGEGTESRVSTQAVKFVEIECDVGVMVRDGALVYGISACQAAISAVKTTAVNARRRVCLIKLKTAVCSHDACRQVERWAHVRKVFSEQHLTSQTHKHTFLAGNYRRDFSLAGSERC